MAPLVSLWASFTESVCPFDGQSEPVIVSISLAFFTVNFIGSWRASAVLFSLSALAMMFNLHSAEIGLSRQVAPDRSAGHPSQVAGHFLRLVTSHFRTASSSSCISVYLFVWQTFPLSLPPVSFSSEALFLLARLGFFSPRLCLSLFQFVQHQ